MGASSGSVQRLVGPVHRAVEWTLVSSKARKDPWREVSVWAVMKEPDGTSLRVPAFWDGGATWRVRLTAATPGPRQVRTESSDPSDAGLHDQRAVFEVEAPGPDQGNPLYRHGAVRIAAAGSFFEHADGKPFHWFADTWWMQMSERVSWPEGFARLCARRVSQGFTVAQIVLGFAPDTAAFDGRDDNAGGSPWLPGFERINPAYFQACDRRLAHVVESGIVPCILGGWGYHLLAMGKDRMLAHWRYLVARYAAWPVVWCLAGEAAMPFYLTTDKDGDTEALRAAWPEVARTVHEADPWRRPLTLHPRRRSWEDTTAPETLDFHMTQAGHMPTATRLALEHLEAGRKVYPDRIIVNAEPPYERHGGANGPEVQRFSFWSSMLSGASGFTYGAAGIFQANDRERPTGNRPDGGAYDSVFWDEAMMFSGGEQLAAANRLLRSLEFHRFEPHPEWASIDLRWGHEAYAIPPRAYAAGIPAKVRLIYLPVRYYHWDGPLVRGLEPGTRYRAAYLETTTLQRYELGTIGGDARGEWRGPTLPFMQDWLLLLERA
jgi:hypothetical protein